MREWFKALVEHLRNNRSNIVNRVDIVVDDWDPTFGHSTSVETTDLVDFDKLLEELDAFAETFKRENTDE